MTNSIWIWRVIVQAAIPQTVGKMRDWIMINYRRFFKKIVWVAIRSTARQTGFTGIAAMPVTIATAQTPGNRPHSIMSNIFDSTGITQPTASPVTRILRISRNIHAIVAMSIPGRELPVNIARKVLSILRTVRNVIEVVMRMMQNASGEIVTVLTDDLGDMMMTEKFGNIALPAGLRTTRSIAFNGFI